MTVVSDSIFISSMLHWANLLTRSAKFAKPVSIGISFISDHVNMYSNTLFDSKLAARRINIFIL